MLNIACLAEISYYSELSITEAVTFVHFSLKGVIQHGNEDHKVLTHSCCFGEAMHTISLRCYELSLQSLPDLMKSLYADLYKLWDLNAY